MDNGKPEPKQKFLLTSVGGMPEGVSEGETMRRRKNLGDPSAKALAPLLL